MSLGGCEICDILRNEHDKVNGRTLRTFLIDDLDLASSKKHILVFPLEHVESIDELSSQQDIELIKEMLWHAKTYLEKNYPGKTYRFGFHKPPHISVYHLHLHGFVLPFDDKAIDLIRYGHLLQSPQQIIDLVMNKRKEKQSPTL